MKATRIAVLVLVIVVSAGLAARLAPRIVTTADIAVTELYTELASHGQLLVGPYSRFGWHHPGPLYFYFLVPGYVLAGRAGAALYTEAVVINVGAVTILLATLFAMRRFLIAVMAVTACLVFAVRADGVIGSPWTAHIVVLPTLALLVLCATIAEGRTRLLAAAAAAASFVVQTDVALGPPVLAVVVLALVAVTVRSVRLRIVPSKDLAVAGVVSIILWIPPIVDAMRDHGGNIGALWRFFAHDAGRAHSMREALAYWSYGLVGVARSDLTLPWGGHLDISSAPWAVPAALTLVIALATWLVIAGRAGESFDAWLSAVILTAALASLWGLMQARGDILDHEIFWLVALGAWGAAVAGAAAIGWLQRKPRTWDRVDRRVHRVSEVLLGCLAVLGAVQAIDFVGKDERSALGHDVVPAALSIDTYFEREHTRAAVIEIKDVWAQAVPIILRLRQHHRRVAVPPASIFMFTDALAPAGREDAWLRITGPGETPKSGESLLFDSYRVTVIAEPGRFPGLR